MAIRRFIEFNRRISGRIARLLPQARVNPGQLYDRTVARLANDLPAGIVVDAGGGRACSFASLLDEKRRFRLVAVDLSAEELARNRDVDETRVADIGCRLPFGEGEIDLLVSRTVLEHVHPVEVFFAEAGRVIRTGGCTVHMVPCRHAPFAIVARLLPFNLAKSILHFVNPRSAGVVEFPVFYNRCTPGQLRRLLEENGFHDVTTTITYYQSDYFEAFLPAYLLSVAYELLIWGLGIEPLGAYVVVTAKR